MIKAVIDILLADTAVTALVDQRVFPNKRFQDSIDVPAIIVSRVGLDTENVKGKTSVADNWQFELVVFSETYEEAAKIAGLCRTALDNFIGAQSGFNIDRMFILDESDDYNIGEEIDSVRQLYECQLAVDGNGPNYPPGVSDPADVRNSDGSYAQTVAAGGTLLLPDITLTKMNGETVTHPSVKDIASSFVTIYLVNTLDEIIQTITAWPSGNRILLANMDLMLADGNSIDQPITDETNIPLLAPSYTSDGDEVIPAPSVWPSGGVQELGTVTHTDSDGSSVVKKWGEAFVAAVCTPGITPSGVMYQCIGFFQKTSYRTGDEGYYLQNGNGEVVPTNPEKIMMLDYSKAEPFDYVTPANVFGHFNRFAHTDGTIAARLVVPSDGIIIDTLTGWDFYVVRQSAATWNDAVDSCEAGTWGGFTNWRLPSKRLIESLQNHERSYIDEPPGFGNLALANIWTATTYELGSTSAYSTFTGGNYRFAITGKTSTRNFIACRPRFAQS